MKDQEEIATARLAEKYDKRFRNTALAGPRVLKNPLLGGVAADREKGVSGDGKAMGNSERWRAWAAGLERKKALDRPTILFVYDEPMGGFVLSERQLGFDTLAQEPDLPGKIM